MRLVQVHVLATLRATLLDFYFAYEHAPRGYAHLQLELRAWVCGAWAVEVVVGSGGGATAKLLWPMRGQGGCPYRVCGMAQVWPAWDDAYTVIQKQGL